MALFDNLYSFFNFKVSYLRFNQHFEWNICVQVFMLELIFSQFSEKLEPNPLASCCHATIVSFNKFLNSKLQSISTRLVQFFFKRNHIRGTYTYMNLKYTIFLTIRRYIIYFKSNHNQWQIKIIHSFHTLCLLQLLIFWSEECV